MRRGGVRRGGYMRRGAADRREGINLRGMKGNKRERKLFKMGEKKGKGTDENRDIGKSITVARKESE